MSKFFTIQGRRRALVSLPAAAAVFLLFSVGQAAAGPAQTTGLNKQEVLSKVAGEWMAVGTEQLSRGLYEHAEKSFLLARQYSEHLSSSKQAKLKQLIEQAHNTQIHRARIRQHISQAKKLLKQGKLNQARKHFETASKDSYLTQQEKQLLQQMLAAGSKLNQSLQELSGLYYQSIRHFQQGYLEKARQGFVEITRSGLEIGDKGKTPADYLSKIDVILLRRAELSLTGEAPVGRLPFEKEPISTEKRPKSKTKSPEQSRQGLLEVTSPLTKEAKQPDEKQPIQRDHKLTRREKLMRAYIGALVKKAVNEAKYQLQQDNAQAAKKTIDYAMKLVQQHRTHLGEPLYWQHTEQLEQIAEKTGSPKKNQSANKTKGVWQLNN